MTCTTETQPFDHPIRDFSARLLSPLKAYQRRRRFRKLLDLDDHMLDDLGVTRSEVITASYLPLSENAATELYRMSLERRRNRM